MSEERRSVDANRLNFLYNKISVPKMAMVYWLQVPEFASAISAKVLNGDTVDDKVVYDIMVPIYESALKVRGTDVAKCYNYAKLRQGIKRLGEALGQ